MGGEVGCRGEGGVFDNGVKGIGYGLICFGCWMGGKGGEWIGGSWSWELNFEGEDCVFVRILV